MSEKMQVELTDDAISKIRAGAEAFQGMEKLARDRLERIRELEQELKLKTMELDRLQVDIHDMGKEVREALQATDAAVRTRIQYETLVHTLARTLVEFVPQVPPHPMPVARAIDRELKSPVEAAGLTAVADALK